MVSIDQFLQVIKVLYVEDEDITRTITRKILKNKINNLLIATNGQEGLDLFNTHKPDIVITDIKMPILDGINMIKEIRNIEQECGIIITTELNELNFILQSVDIGIDKYILKPISEEDLNEALVIVMKKMSKRKAYNKLFHEVLDFNKDDKKRIEEELKADMSNFMKKSIGKGPRYIKIIITNDIIEVRAHEVLNSMEKNLIKNSNNVKLVEYNRSLFYQDKKTEIEALVSNRVNRNVVICDVSVDIIRDEDRMVFKCIM